MKRLFSPFAVVLLCVSAAGAATYVNFESITVATTPIGFTAATINNVTGIHLAATQAMCVVTSASVNYQINGTTTVTSATTGGLPASIGTPIYLSGNDILNNFRAVSQSASTAILNCAVSRP